MPPKPPFRLWQMGTPLEDWTPRQGRRWGEMDKQSHNPRLRDGSPCQVHWVWRSTGEIGYVTKQKRERIKDKKKSDVQGCSFVYSACVPSKPQALGSIPTTRKGWAWASPRKGCPEENHVGLGSPEEGRGAVLLPDCFDCWAKNKEADTGQFREIQSHTEQEGRPTPKTSRESRSKSPRQRQGGQDFLLKTGQLH